MQLKLWSDELMLFFRYKKEFKLKVHLMCRLYCYLLVILVNATKL